MNQHVRYFHGGKPGLRPGEYVVPSPPHYVDGCAICEAKKQGRDVPYDPANHRPDQVFVTIDREYARFYASKLPRGDLYVVDPEGELVESSEDHFPTWSCPRARVVSVFARFVVLNPRQRLTMLHRWRRSDEAVLAAAVARQQLEDAVARMVR